MPHYSATVACVVGGILMSVGSTACTQAQCLRQSDCPPSFECRIGICKSRLPTPDAGIIYVYDDAGTDAEPSGAGDQSSDDGQSETPEQSSSDSSDNPSEPSQDSGRGRDNIDASVESSTDQR